MTGLSKITDKIIGEARAEAAARLKEADAQCRKITDEYKARAEQVAAKIAADAKNEAAEVVARAKASEKTIARDSLLKARGDMTDRAFEVAKAELEGLNDSEKLGLLTSLMTSALFSEYDNEQSRGEIYGEEAAEGERIYEVILTQKDREKLGDKLMESFRRSIVGRNMGDLPSRVRLSEDTAEIGGGLVIRVGSVEINCSFESIVEGLRTKLEADVAKILFS